MKKVGVGIISLLILSLLQVLTVTAQECADPCEDNTWCDIDNQCTNNCCEPIPCTTDVDCPFACAPAPAGFSIQACNTCLNGFCHDPCDCDFGKECGGSGPCSDSVPRCVFDPDTGEGDCVQCETDCDCADPTKSLSLSIFDCDADNDNDATEDNANCLNNPFSRCGTPDLCFRRVGGPTSNPKPDCVNNDCVAGTFTCSVTECVFDSQCDDNEPCTDDICGDNGLCSNPDNTDPCTDGNDCTYDTCSGGTCTSTNNNVGCGCKDQCITGTCTQNCLDSGEDSDFDGYYTC